MSIGENIRERRKQEGLTQEQFAELIYMDRGHLAKIELGIKEPTLKQFALIADVFGCFLDDLYYGGRKDGKSLF